MKLYIKQQAFALGDTYHVYDEYEHELYYVKAEFLTFLRHIHIYDFNNDELGVVHSCFSLLPKYEIEIRGEIVGTITKRFTLFDHQFAIDFNGWYCEGDFLGWDFDIYDRYDHHIAHIAKELFHFTDHYVLDIDNQEDELYVLMLAIAIDAYKDSAADAANSANH